MRHFALALAFGLSLAACGGDGDDGGTPVAPTPTPTGMSVSAPRTTLRVGQTETYTVTVTMSNGQSQTVQASWRSDNTAVLTIDDTGRARGVSNGTATIVATAQGFTATQLIRVVTDYQGTWEGDYTVRLCDASGDWRDMEFCDREDGFWPGEMLPVRFVLSQDRDQVTGTLHLGAVDGTASGTAGANGDFTGTASLTLLVEGVAVAFDVPTLKLRADGDRMTGNFVVTVTAPGATGRGYLENDLKTVVRTAAFAPLGVTPKRFPSFREAWQGFRR